MKGKTYDLLNFLIIFSSWQPFFLCLLSLSLSVLIYVLWLLARCTSSLHIFRFYSHGARIPLYHSAVHIKAYEIIGIRALFQFKGETQKLSGTQQIEYVLHSISIKTFLNAWECVTRRGSGEAFSAYLSYCNYAVLLGVNWGILSERCLAERFWFGAVSIHIYLQHFRNHHPKYSKAVCYAMETNPKTNLYMFNLFASCQPKV